VTKLQFVLLRGNKVASATGRERCHRLLVYLKTSSAKFQLCILSTSPVQTQVGRNLATVVLLVKLGMQLIVPGVCT